VSDESVRAGSVNILIGLTDPDWDNDYEANGGDVARVLEDDGPGLEEMLRATVRKFFVEEHGVDEARLDFRVDVWD
jgi:hypothetical protein